MTSFDAKLSTLSCDGADPHVAQWFASHARLFNIGGTDRIGEGGPPLKNIYFLEAQSECGFVYFYRAPLRFRGTYNEADNFLRADIGIQAKSDVYLPLANLVGRPGVDRIEAEFDQNPDFWAGDVKVTGTTTLGKDGVAVFGIDVVLNWVGIGTEMVGNIISIKK